MAERQAVTESEQSALRLLHLWGVNLGVTVMAGASALTFLLALVRLVAAVLFVFGVGSTRLGPVFAAFGIERVPIVLMLINVVDAAILAVIFLTFAFGLKAVFLGKRYEVLAFDIRNIDELKAYLIGLVVVLMSTRFLEFILADGGSERDLLSIGVGMGAMILALSAYTITLRKYGDVEPPSKPRA